MNFKLALLAAAVVGAATSAQAADLAMKAPAAANYVKVCDAYGEGFFYIPGTETCLKIGGYMQVDALTGGGDLWPTYGSERDRHNMTTGFEADVQIDARTSTEMGLLRSFIEARWTGASGAYGASDQNAFLKKGYVQFGGLTAGLSQSFFDFFTGASVGYIEPHWSDEVTNLFAYTFAFGNGITATLSIEDPTRDRRADGLAAFSGYDYYGGHKVPDVVGNVNVTQAWGSAQVMAAYHQNYDIDAGQKAGWAVGAGVNVNLPMLGAGDYVVLQGAYTKGAVNYASVNFATGNYAYDYGWEDYGVLNQSKAWSISGGFHHEFSKQVAFNFDAGYADFDGGYDEPVIGGSISGHSWTLSGDVTWTPVAGLAIIPHVSYIDESVTDDSSWVGGLRIKRSF